MSTSFTKPTNQDARPGKSANQRRNVYAPVKSDLDTKPTNQDARPGKPANQSRNAYAPVRSDPDSDYVTPGAFELEQLFWASGGAEYTHVNEVWPRLFIGDEKTALERPHLEAMGMTHILNAAEGRWNSVSTGASFYSGMGIHYYGIQAEDTPSFDMAQFFYPAADFMHQALSQPESKLLVHCVMGRSRSATLVLAYLMIYEHLGVVAAITHLRQRRCVLPNRGFIKQLRALDITLQQHRREDTRRGGEERDEERKKGRGRTEGEKERETES